MIEPAPVVSDSVADKKKPAKKTAGNTAREAGATVKARRKKKLEKWPFEWLPFGMQE